MATVKETLHTDLTAAMRSREELHTTTLRMVLTAIKTEEVAGTSERELSEEEVRAVIRREVKKRRDSATLYAEHDRADRAARENAEADLLQAYLPAAMDDAELSALVAEHVAAVAATGATGMAAMGAVMKGVRPAAGERADGGRINAEVRRQLQG